MQSKLFDHKAILLSFKPCATKNTRPVISEKILRDPDIEIVVKLASYECFLQNAADIVNKNRLLPYIGNCFRLLRQAGPDPNYVEYAFGKLLDVDVRTGIIQELRQVMTMLEEEGIPEMASTVDDDIFLETLMNNVRNEVISYQAFIFKTVNESYDNLLKSIDVLKASYTENFIEISELELKLREINEIRINSILEKNCNFDKIHGERITPFF